MVLLELVGLHHHLPLDAAVARLAVVRDVQVVIVRDARQLLHIRQSRVVVRVWRARILARTLG